MHLCALCFLLGNSTKMMTVLKKIFKCSINAHCKSASFDVTTTIKYGKNSLLKQLAIQCVVL